MFKLSDVEENIAQPASKKAGFVLSDVEQPDLTKIKPQNVFSIDGEKPIRRLKILRMVLFLKMLSC